MKFITATRVFKMYISCSEMTEDTSYSRTTSEPVTVKLHLVTEQNEAHLMLGLDP